ncbi:MAG: hypothetical protein JNN11_01250 [Candidatus Doudnabacteria bacterium]|nr:hypothetical protein [Candidatus Doudnabacteria bacterium]
MSTEVVHKKGFWDRLEDKLPVIGGTIIALLIGYCLYTVWRDFRSQVPMVPAHQNRQRDVNSALQDRFTERTKSVKSEILKGNSQKAVETYAAETLRLEADKAKFGDPKLALRDVCPAEQIEGEIRYLTQLDKCEPNKPILLVLPRSYRNSLHDYEVKLYLVGPDGKRVYLKGHDPNLKPMFADGHNIANKKAWGEYGLRGDVLFYPEGNAHGLAFGPKGKLP